MKRVLIIMMALAMVLTLAACGPKESPEDAQNKAMVNDVYAAEYKTIDSKYAVDEKYGVVGYAADGTAQDGTQVMAIFVRSSTVFDTEGALDMGYDSQYPAAYQMVIVIDKATNKVLAYKVMRDGTNQKDYFTVPAEKIDAYKDVVIASETAFDDFTQGLVTEKLFDTEPLPSDNTEVITGTSLIYTGATVKGTYSGQLVLRCFQAAARFYANNK